MTAISFNAPITSDQYTHLRQSHWQADQNISLVDNIVAFSCQLASTQPTVSGSTSAILPYDTVSSGDISNLDEGMVVIVSPTIDPRHPLAVRLRLRLDGNAHVVADGTNLYVSEYSDILGADSFISVFYSYDLIDSLSRPVGTNPVVQFEDYNQPYEGMAPVIRGTDTQPIQTAYAGYCDANGHFDVPFDATGSFSPEFGASISTYAYSVVATGAGTFSVLSGNPATAIVTYRFTAGEYWVRIDETDDNGVTNFRHVLIKAHDDDYPPQDGFEGVEITRDFNQGPAARVKYYAGVDTMLNGTMCVIWVKELYSDEDFGNPSASLFGNIDLIGWIESEEDEFQTDPVASSYSEVQFEIQGVAARLARIEGQLLAITNSASPTKWDQINQLTPWRAIVHFLQRHTQAFHLCDFNTDDTGETYLFPTITTMAGRALDNCTGNQGIAEEYNAQLEFARDGRIQLVRKAPFVTSYVSELTHVATWLRDDITGRVTLKFNHYQQYGYLNADGAFWGGGTASPIPCRSRAPGLAQSSGTDQGQLNNQILPTTTSQAGAQSVLNDRAGTQFAIDNNTGELSVKFFDGYWWLETSYNQLYVFDMDIFVDVRGIDLNAETYWACKSVSVRHDNKTGSREVDATFIPIITGFPGTTVPIVNAGSVAPQVPVLPPMPAFDFELPETTIPDVGLTPTQAPPKPKVADRIGNTVLEINADGNELAITLTYITLASPVWRTDITPALDSGFTLRDAKFDQLATTTAVYALASDGTNSILYYNPNVLDASSAWKSDAGTFSGEYVQMRIAGNAGDGLMYESNGSSATIANLTSVTTADIINLGILSDNTVGVGDTFTFTSVAQPPGHNPFDGKFTSDVNLTLEVISATGFTADTDPFPWQWFSPDILFSTFPVAGDTGNLIGGFAGNSGTLAVTGFKVLAIAGSSAKVRSFSSHGATVGSEVTVGDTPGPAGGVDLIRSGGVSYAAAQNKVRKATTLGGSYSDLAALSANAMSIAIPYYQVGSTTVTQTASATPQAIIGYDVAVGGSCLAIMSGAGALTPITNPASGAGFIGPNRITMLRGTKIAIIVRVLGVHKLYVAEDLAADGSCTWTFVENVGQTANLRSRRNDPRNGAHKGQLYVFDTTDSGYSSKWASATEWDRTSPSGVISTGDILG